MVRGYERNRHTHLTKLPLMLAFQREEKKKQYSTVMLLAQAGEGSKKKETTSVSKLNLLSSGTTPIQRTTF